MIDAAKADAGSLTLQQGMFRPRSLIEGLSEALAARAETKGLRTEISVADDLPDLLLGDAVRLRAALENLIDNAVKFTAHGTIRLEAQARRAARGRVRLDFTIIDSGIGLSRAEVARLFRPFAQANAEIARRYGGAGLGLAVVKLLAKRMGGDLTVTSTPGRGSQFRFTAVLAVARDDGSADLQARPDKPPGRRLKFSASRITPMAASFSTPSSPRSATMRISPALAKRRSRPRRAVTMRC